MTIERVRTLLEQLGTHGLQLNLNHKDPTTSPPQGFRILKSMKQFARVAAGRPVSRGM